MRRDAGEEGLDVRIVIEPETDGDSRSLFRLFVGEKLVAEGMTAAQTHLLVGDILERIALPNKPRKSNIQRSGRAKLAGGP